MVEKAEYTVVRAIGSVEIREYPTLIVARVEGHRDGAFNILFKFITGNNRQRAEVAMTAPVISESIEMTAPVLSEAESMSFVMPKKFKLDTVPEPLDERVKIVEVPGRYLGVLRFSGRWNGSIFERRSGELLEVLEGAGMKTRGSVFSMLYNPPYTPWFMRRNEVAVEVEEP